MGDLADATIVIGILAQVFFLEYYGLGRYLNWVITGMICVRRSSPDGNIAVERYYLG